MWKYVYVYALSNEKLRLTEYYRHHVLRISTYINVEEL